MRVGGSRHVGRTTRRTVFAVVVATVAVAAVPVHASSNIADLGKPTSDVPPYNERPANFARVASPVHRSGRVTVYLFDTLWDNDSAAGRWPLVKALEQFGSWSGLQIGEAGLPLYQAGRLPNGATYGTSPPFPTYDLSRASYHSRYVSFVHRVVQVTKGGPHTRLSARETALFDKSVRLQTYFFPINWARNVAPALPAYVVGAYGTHGPPMDLSASQQTSTEARFDEQLRSFQQGDAGDYQIRDANTFANVVAAYICYQDGMRPSKVCHRWAVRTIMKLPHFRR